MRNVPEVFDEVTKEFANLAAEATTAIVPYALEDAKVAIVSLGSASGTIRWVARNLRKKGLPVGALKIASYRPFPHEEVGKMLETSRCSNRT